MNIIETRDICFSYNTKEVLTNVSFFLKQGEFLGIIGPNGAGKSTILRLICGILRPKHGTITVSDHDTRGIERKQLAKKIAFVPQETHFVLNFTVEEIVMMGRFPYLRAFQRENKTDYEARDHALAYTDLQDFRKRPINSLSSGERQRVVLARALAQEPAILILDEPTSYLDLHHQFAIMELLKKLNKEGMSIIVVNHDLNLASLYCKRLILMHQGKVFEQGSPGELINERILKEVYQTDVKVIKHPHIDVPHILLKPKGE
ncbi:MAG: heme ABC transporter ATP-binding protein [bacterium]